MSNPVIEVPPVIITPTVPPVVPPIVPVITPTVPPVVDPPAADDVASLPDWAQKQIKDLRTENADRRTRATTAETALKAAKTPEEFATALAEWTKTNTDLERALVAARFQLPETLADRLKGTTREELEADAKSLQLLINIPPVTGDLSGGLTPNSDDDGESSPLALAKRANRTRLF